MGLPSDRRYGLPLPPSPYRARPCRLPMVAADVRRARRIDLYFGIVAGLELGKSAQCSVPPPSRHLRRRRRTLRYAATLATQMQAHAGACHRMHSPLRCSVTAPPPAAGGTGAMSIASRRGPPLPCPLAAFGATRRRRRLRQRHEGTDGIPFCRSMSEGEVVRRRPLPRGVHERRRKHG